MILVILGVITIRGYKRTKADESKYKLRVQKMTDAELKHELINFNNMTKHMPNLVRRNSVDGGWLTVIKSQAKIVKQEMRRRGI